MKGSGRSSGRSPLPAQSALLTAIATLSSFALAAGEARGESIAFFYARPVPVAELSHFDRVVLEPDNVAAAELAALERAGTEVFAYLSLGEVHPTRAYFAQVATGWVLASNPTWGGKIVDPGEPGWRALLVREALRLRDAGYRGLFLDTLDAYRAAPGTGAEMEARRLAMARLIGELHERAPQLKLILNRGFELLPDLGAIPTAVAAESLFVGVGTGAAEYAEVSEEDRRWLLGRLKEVRDRYGAPVIVIDYLPPRERERARSVARAIRDLGFTPWVADRALETVGVGSIEVIPRRVLALHSSGTDTDACAAAALPLEHLGYAVDFLDARLGFPAGRLGQRYAGLVTCVRPGPPVAAEEYRAFLLRQIQGGLPVAFLEHLPVDDTRLLAALGLAAARPTGAGARVENCDGRIAGFESPVVPPRQSFEGVRAEGSAVQSQLRIVDASGQAVDPIATAPWGGAALAPYVFADGDGGRRWVLNPFEFLRRALRLEPLPAPDVTTENGRRIATLVLRGEGLAAALGVSPDAAAGLRDLGQPVTLLVTAADLGAAGGGPPARAERLARQLLRSPQFEPAASLDGGPGGSASAEEALRFVEKRLASQQRPARVMLVPARPQPPASALSLLADLGVAPVALATGAATGSRGIAELPALESPLGPALQLHAPLGGCPRLDRGAVEQVFAASGSPRRLSPVALAVRMGCPRELRGVASWLRDQPTVPLWVSEWAERARAFREVTLSRDLEGRWQLRGATGLRTLRLDPALGWPDSASSQGVAGWVDQPEGRYASLSGQERVRLSLVPAAPDGVRLAWANAPLVSWRAEGRDVAFRLRGHVPLRFAIAGADDCRLTVGGRVVAGRLQRGERTFALSALDTGEARLVCGEVRR